MLVPTPEEFFILDEIENDEPSKDFWQIGEPKVETTGRDALYSIFTIYPSSLYRLILDVFHIADDSLMVEDDAYPAVFREIGMLKGNHSVPVKLPQGKRDIPL